MAYYPLSQIKTGFFTNGQEYVYKNTTTLYQGPYWKTSKGQIFSGQGPNDPTTAELQTKPPTFGESSDELGYIPEGEVGYGTKQVIRLAFGEPDFDFDSEELTPKSKAPYIGEIVETYLSITKQDINNLPIIDMPFYNAKPPTEKDYTVGEFRRYFCKKNNEVIYLEIDKNTHDALQSKTPTSAWTLYTPFNIPWQITGDRENTYKTNKNITELEILRKNLKSFAEYLKNDYLKYYRG